MKKQLLIILSFLSFQISEAQTNPVKNVILMIGDGMGAAQVYAGLIANHGWLNLEKVQFVGFHKNQSTSDFVTDSGAGATAFSIGEKTHNSAIGVDQFDVPKPTILEIAKQHKKATGLVVSCSIEHATPAAFISHQPQRSMFDEIAEDIAKSKIDMFIGGGRKYFYDRKDKKNLLDTLSKNGFQVANGLNAIQNIHEGKLAGFIAEEEPVRVTLGRGDQLLQSTNKALEILSKNKDGFFLMVEGSQIDWGGHANDSSYVLNEMVDFDKAIGAVLEFAKNDKNTLVVITADHETGGMSILDGDFTSGNVKMKFTTDGHTGVMIPVYSFGPNAEKFSGIYQNSDIFFKMMNAFQFKN
jgi:alkaline phosphatase